MLAPPGPGSWASPPAPPSPPEGQRDVPYLCHTLPPPKVYLKTPTKCILFIYSPWCVGGLAPLAWFFVINISVRSPRGCAWWGCGGGRGGGLRPRTAQLCGDCSLSWWGLGSAGTCPAPGEGHVLLWGAVGLYTLFTGNKYSAAGSGLPAPPLALLWPIFKRFPAGRREDISPCSEPPLTPPRTWGHRSLPRGAAQGTPCPYSLSWWRRCSAHQPSLAGAHLVDAEGQPPGGHMAALPQLQPLLAQQLAVPPCTAAARPAVLIPLAPCSLWGGGGQREGLRVESPQPRAGCNGPWGLRSRSASCVLQRGLQWVPVPAAALMKDDGTNPTSITSFRSRGCGYGLPHPPTPHPICCSPSCPSGTGCWHFPKVQRRPWAQWVSRRQYCPAGRVGRHSPKCSSQKCPWAQGVVGPHGVTCMGGGAVGSGGPGSIPAPGMVLEGSTGWDWVRVLRVSMEPGLLRRVIWDPWGPGGFKGLLAHGHPSLEGGHCRSMQFSRRKRKPRA